MAKIVFFCIPAQGHTNPTLGVVRELTRRGHQVWYWSWEPFREKIEAAGAVFVPCDEHCAGLQLTPREGARTGSDLVFSTRILAETTLALDEPVCTFLRQLQPDCVAADSMAVWGRGAALKLGIPFVSSTTTFAFNRHSARIMKQSLWDGIKLLIALPAIQQQVRRLQDRGYPFKNILDVLQNDENTHTIVYTSPEFQPCAERFSDKYAFVGPSIRPAAAPIQKTRPVLVYISMGTVNNDLLHFYRQCVAAFADSPYQIILSVGTLVSPVDLGLLPKHITAVPHIDQIAVLQKADVFLTHCGMNSATEGLYHGVPLVLAPRTQEQQGVAERVRQLGAGLLLTGTDAASIRNAAEQALADPAYREAAARIGADFRRCPGAAGAADKVLQVCGLSPDAL